MTDRREDEPGPHGGREPEGDATERDRATRSRAQQDLRANTEALREDLDRLQGIEAEKASLDAEDPRVDDLSEEAAGLGDRIHSETHAQGQLAEEAS